jgi:hypothetical protein
MIQTTGSYDSAADSYTMTVANDGIGMTLEALSRHEVEEIADLALSLLFCDGESYTWHSEFEPNDVF